MHSSVPYYNFHYTTRVQSPSKSKRKGLLAYLLTFYILMCGYSLHWVHCTMGRVNVGRCNNMLKWHVCVAAQFVVFDVSF